MGDNDTRVLAVAGCDSPAVCDRLEQPNINDVPEITYDILVSRYKERFPLQKYGTVNESGRRYKLYKIDLSRGCKKFLLITSGFHGEEFNGPISLLQAIDSVVEYAKKKGVGLIIYPCLNPSGFDREKRYNASREHPNNDFLRYWTGKRWVGTLLPDEKFYGYKLASSPAKEIRLFQRDLRRSGLLDKRLPLGVVDIHQDWEELDGDYYLYTFSERQAFRELMKKIDEIARRARNQTVIDTTENGRKICFATDREGLIKLHDGTLTDLYYRLGSPYSFTVETTTRCPVELVARINETILRCVIDLVKKAKIRHV